MGGRAVTNIPGDFLISDQEAVVSSILRGPDQRTAISDDTSRVIYTVYAPAGVKSRSYPATSGTSRLTSVWLLRMPSRAFLRSSPFRLN
jgi:hypothetical protein